MELWQKMRLGKPTLNVEVLIKLYDGGTCYVKMITPFKFLTASGLEIDVENVDSWRYSR